jgi:hypothetical protein
VTDRYCRNCGHELAETDRFCPNCGTPVHEAAHVPTPEADVDVPLPPQQGVATAPTPDEVEGREDDFPVAFFTAVATVGGGVSAALAGLAALYPGYSMTNATRWTYLAFALFFGLVLPVVVGFAFGYSIRRLRPLPSHSAILAISTFLFGIICVMVATKLKVGGENVIKTFFMGWHAAFVYVPASVSITTAMFYTFSAFIGHARRRQKAGETSGMPTSVREVSDQPQTPRQQAMAQLSGENWTPRQQAMVGLIGTITAALIGLFGTLLTVFLNT